MSCKNDVRKAIYDATMKELTEGRYTFNRVDDNTIQINGRVDNSRTKAQSREQARAIAKQIIQAAHKSFDGHVTGYITENSAYDPITVTFKASDNYVNHVYDNLPTSEQTDSSTLEKQDHRDLINSNAGVATYQQQFLFAPSTGATGVYEKFVQHKKILLSTYKDRITKLEREEKTKNITTARLTQIKNEKRELKTLTEGKLELGIKGLVHEIKEMEKAADRSAIAYYVQKDLDRLKKLSGSSDVDDLKEAQRIIDFYTQAGDFSWKTGTESGNPFFSKDEIFAQDINGNLTSTHALSTATMKQYEDWAKEAKGEQNIIDKQLEELTVSQVNNNRAVNKTYKGKQFDFGELTYADTGLGDTNWIDMWTMDITNGTFSKNGLIPQVMFSTLTGKIEEKLAWSREIEERVNHAIPKVEAALKAKGYGFGTKLLGLKGVSYKLFLEKTKEGNETGGLVQRYNKEYWDERAKAFDRFGENFDNALAEPDPAKQQKAFNKAFEEKKAWLRKNTIIMDIKQIPEIASDADFAEFFPAGHIVTNAHKDELTKILGTKGYNEQVEAQKRQLRKFQSERQSTIDTALILEGKAKYADLSPKAKNDIGRWESNHNPVRGHEDYHSIRGLFIGSYKTNSFMDYNTFIPRKYEASIKPNLATDSYDITDTNKSTPHYSSQFDEIEKDGDLSNFYDIIKEVLDVSKEYLPEEVQSKMASNALFSLQKTSSEIIAHNSNGFLSSISAAYYHLMDRFRTSFGVNKQSNLSYASIDPITGRKNYEVNDAFISNNAKAIRDRSTIEKTRFIQSYNAGVAGKGSPLSNIRRFTTLPINSMGVDTLILVAQYANIDISMNELRSGNLTKITSKLGTDIEVGRLIRDFATHTTVQNQSFDLAKMAKYFSNMTMTYAARQESLPILEIMKKHYEQIDKPDTNNTGQQFYSPLRSQYLKDGKRTAGNRQMENWFDRVVLNHTGDKHMGIMGKKPTANNKTPFLGENIYTKEEKAKFEEIENLIKNETDQDKIDELKEIQASMGKTRTATAAMNNLLNWIKTLRLGYNISSGITNFLEGVTSNMILGASDEYFDPKELLYGYNTIKHSFVKNMTFGHAETGIAKKVRVLMDKHDVVMDSKNELQKSSHKTFSSRLSWLNPHELNQRVEFINQSPLMIAILRTMKLTGINGEVSSVWDAYDKEGQLLPQFKTAANVENWEKMTGDDYLNYKENLRKVINIGHGNYDEMRGMLIKSSTMGKAGMMFKTWLPNALYWRFATEQDDIQTGTIGYKGRYWSYGKGSAMVHGGIVGLATFGPLGAAIGAGAGLALGAWKGADSGVGMLAETLMTIKQLFKKALGMPVNLIMGKQLIKDGKGFESWVGQGKFTEQDAKNMKGNMADLAMQLAWLAMILVTKSLFWDDDDDPNAPERVAHNILVNKLMQLSTQAAMYTNPVDTWKGTIGSMATAQYLTDVGKWIGKLSEFLHGRDITQSGENAGQSALWNQTKKIALPGLLKDGNPLIDIAKGHIPSLGFKGQMKRVYPEESWMHPYFRSEEYKDKRENKGERAARRSELEDTPEFKAIEDDKLRKKEINKVLNEELPTTAKLKKLGETRKEYEQEHKKQ